MTEQAPFGSRILGTADEPATRLRVRLQTLTTAAILTANLVGAVVVTVLSGWVLPRPEGLTHSMFVANAVAIPAYVIAAMAVVRPPYEDQLGRPSYEVCPNCGFEFGNDDNPGTGEPVSFNEYRREWVSDGSPRFSTQ